MHFNFNLLFSITKYYATSFISQTTFDNTIRFHRISNNDARFEENFEELQKSFQENFPSTRITCIDMQNACKRDGLIPSLWNLVIEMISR